MKALTLTSPWAEAVVRFGKRVENRSWPLPEGFLGERIALHQGKKFDAVSALWIADLVSKGEDAERDRIVRELEASTTGAILGVVRFRSIRRMISPVPPEWPSAIGDWACGPWLWEIDEVVALRSPVPCRGMQRLWNLPLRIEREVERQLAEKERSR